MKLDCKIFWISLVISIIAIASSVYLRFFTDNNNMEKFILGILLNIFSGTLVLVITSLYKYNADRKDVLESIMKQCHEMEKMFEKNEYFNGEDYMSVDEFAEKYKNINGDSKIDEKYEEYKNF